MRFAAEPMDTRFSARRATCQATHGSYRCSGLKLGPALRRDSMGTAMSNALALMRWHGMREFRHVSHNQILFWGFAGMALLGLLVFAIQRRRRRWF